MAVITFPSSPTLNETFSVGYKTWIWNGYAWDIVVANTNSVFAHANASYDTSNTVGSYANSAFLQANSAFDKANQTITLNGTSVGLGSSYDVTQLLGNSYNNPDMVLPVSSDTAWAFGMYGNDPSYFLQAKFWGGGDANHGFRLYDEHTDTVPFVVDGTGTTTVTSLKADTIYQNNINLLNYIEEVHGEAAGSYDHANAAYQAANVLQGGTATDGWSRIRANAAFDQANAAFYAANTVVSGFNRIKVGNSLLDVSTNSEFEIKSSGAVSVSAVDSNPLSITVSTLGGAQGLTVDFGTVNDIVGVATYDFGTL